MQNLGTRIKEIRETKNMSIYQLANISGLSDSHLGRIENGKRDNPGINTVIKIAEALNITVEDLIEKKDFYKLELSTVEILDYKILVDGIMLNQKQKEQLFEFLVNL
ncbi:MAG: helix-turn-helix domain-containing protein [Clostridium sp.]